MITLDSWDIAAVGGLALVLGGVALLSVPAALVVTGSGILAAYYIRERNSVAQPTPQPGDAPPE